MAGLGLVKKMSGAVKELDIRTASEKLKELQQRFENDVELNSAKATLAKLEGQYEPLGKRAQEAFDAIGEAGGRGKLAGQAGLAAPEIHRIKAQELFDSIQQQRLKLAVDIDATRALVAKRKEALHLEIERELDANVRPVLLREQDRRLRDVLPINDLLLQADQLGFKVNKARRHTPTAWSELSARLAGWKQFVTREFGFNLEE